METRATTNGVQQHAQEQAYIEWREYHTKQSPMCVFYETKEHHLASVCKTLSPRNGYVAQFGVDAGHTLRLLSAQFPKKKVYGFDAWHKKGPGLPDVWTGNIDHSTAFTWTKKEYKELKRSMPKNVKLIPGLFNKQTITATLGTGPASLIHIDCDTGPSTTIVLEAIKDNLRTGTRIVFDEYANYSGWKEHEFKAWKLFCSENKIEYCYTGISNMDVSIKITNKLEQ